MLQDFLLHNQDELLRRCNDNVHKRTGPDAPATDALHGLPILISQLIGTLRKKRDSGGPHSVPVSVTHDIGDSAREHGSDLLRSGFTVEQVVHVYGDLSQAVTELAVETRAEITVDEFQTFNRCLDSAIANAVSEFGRARDRVVADAGSQSTNERLGYLAHALRNKLSAAMLAVAAIKEGSVSITGATGAVLDRSLSGLCNLIDQSLAEVRLTAGQSVERESTLLHDLVEEIKIPLIMEARSRGLTFSITIDEGLVVDVDREMISVAVVNLVRNALKFTHQKGRVWLTARGDGELVIIEIRDECGGLPAKNIERLFHAFDRRSCDRSGGGLGLSISRRSVEANGGTISARDMPGEGCVFTIALPNATRLAHHSAVDQPPS